MLQNLLASTPLPCVRWMNLSELLFPEVALWDWMWDKYMYFYLPSCPVGFSDIHTVKESRWDLFTCALMLSSMLHWTVWTVWSESAVQLEEKLKMPSGVALLPSETTFRFENEQIQHRQFLLWVLCALKLRWFARPYYHKNILKFNSYQLKYSIPI